MPAKNSVKTYAEKSFYHLYNRGVEKREIFVDEQDFGVFLSYLKTYLLPKDEKHLQEIISSPTAGYKEKDSALNLLSLKNFSGEIELIAYVLMPNHFHFLVKQEYADGIDRFMNALCTRYSIYFNKKHHRVGTLYQDVYKAVLVQTDEQLLHLSRYIHLNPFGKLGWQLARWREVPWPYSLPEFLKIRKTDWVKPGDILDYFGKTQTSTSYLDFLGFPPESKILGGVAIDSD